MADIWLRLGATKGKNREDWSMALKQKKIIVYGGTTEGREITDFLLSAGARVRACVATEYGESLLAENENLTISHERQDVEAMKKLFQAYEPDYVIDATHPYAQMVTANIKKACLESGREKTYLRLLREKSLAAYTACKSLNEKNSREGQLIWMNSLTEAVEFLRHTRGNILATTGSKELEVYTRLADYKDRLYARVLSLKSVVDKCDELGIVGRHLICMQGPFSLEMNKAMLRDFQISYMVTKESGSIGGFEEKWQAAAQTDTTLLVVGRPNLEKGCTYEELKTYLQQNE